MGIEEEANRTLFIRNIDQRVTEELLFELFLQAGPLTKTKIPKDHDGKQKTFGFAVYKDEESVPYALKLLDGTSLFGRTIHVQPRNGSTVNSQTSSPVNTPNPHGQWSQGQMNSPPYSPQRPSFGSPDTMQKQVMMSNLMLQIQMTQMQQQQQNGSSLLGPPPQQRQQFGGSGGYGGGGGGSSNGGGGQHDSDSSWQHSSSQMNTGSGGHYSSRGQRYSAEQGSGGGGGGGRHQQHGHGGGGYHYHDNKGGNNYQGNRGSSRHYDDRSDNRGYQDSRRRRY